MSYLFEAFRAYLHVEMTALAQYRANLTLWLIGAVTEPLVFMIVWINVARAQGGSLAGYSESDLAAYYLVLMFLRQATSANGPDLMAYRIRRGDLSLLLLRPLPPLIGDFANTVSGRLATVVPMIPIVLIIGWYFGARVSPPWWSVLGFVLAVLMTGMLRFLLQYSISIAAFWTDQISGIFSTYWTLQTFLSGMLAPLVLLPMPLQLLANVLPFRWIFGFPVDLMLGRLTEREALIGFAAQIGWTAASYLLMRVMWRAGIKRYGAYGG